MVNSLHSTALCCARCARSFSGNAPHCEPDSQSHSADIPDFIEIDDWELNETLRRADRLMRTVRGADEGSWSRIDAAHQDNSSPDPAKPIPLQKANRPPTSSVAWAVLAMGLAVFVCGAALMGLSLLYQREPLWQLGLPMVLGGQVAILAVVIWQLESVWQSNRATFVALHAMDEQLRQLRRESANQRNNTGQGSNGRCTSDRDHR